MSDAKSLEKFYSSEQGKIFNWFIRREIFRRWNIHEDDKSAGLGFTAPYTKLFGKKSYVNLSTEHTAGSVRIAEAQLPFRNAELNRVFAMHYLENLDLPFLALQEIWRVLEPAGSLLLIVPNQQSLWKKSAIAGKQNYAHKQICEMLAANKFHVGEVSHAIFYPPAITSEMAKLLNAVGKTCFPFFGAVTIYHAQKIIFPNRGKPIRIHTNLRDWVLSKKKTVRG